MKGESAAISKVDMDLVLSIASRLIEFPTIRGSSESAAAEWLADLFDSRGYHVAIQEPRPGRHQVVATLRGKAEGPSVMLWGHLDQDPLRADWRRNPWRPVVEGDRLYGAGARNMKGGVATMIGTAEAIRQSGSLEKGELVLACVMGHLEGGIGTKYLLNSGERPDYVLMPEPLGASNIVTSVPGVYEVVVTARGFSEHFNRRFLRNQDESSTPVDAIKIMRRFLDYVDEMDLGFNVDPIFPDLPAIHVGSVIGGRGEEPDLRGSAYVSDRCFVLLHICYPPGYRNEDVHRALEAAIDRFPDREFLELSVDAGTDAIFGYKPFRKEPADLPKDHLLATTVIEAFRATTGLEPENVGVVLPACYTSGESAIFDKFDVPSIYYGPSSPVLTRADADDCVSISEMATVAEVLVRAAQALTGTN